jgi:hypothetical protein
MKSKNVYYKHMLIIYSDSQWASHKLQVGTTTLRSSVVE